MADDNAHEPAAGRWPRRDEGRDGAFGFVASADPAGEATVAAGSKTQVLAGGQGSGRACEGPAGAPGRESAPSSTPLFAAWASASRGGGTVYEAPAAADEGEAWAEGPNALLGGEGPAGGEVRARWSELRGARGEALEVVRDALGSLERLEGLLVRLGASPGGVASAYQVRVAEGLVHSLRDVLAEFGDEAELVSRGAWRLLLLG